MRHRGILLRGKNMNTDLYRCSIPRSKFIVNKLNPDIHHQNVCRCLDDWDYRDLTHVCSGGSRGGEGEFPLLNSLHYLYFTFEKNSNHSLNKIHHIFNKKLQYSYTENPSASGGGGGFAPSGPPPRDFKCSPNPSPNFVPPSQKIQDPSLA